MRRAVSAVALVAMLVAVACAPAFAKVRRGPNGTAFYTPPAKLPGKRHGDLIWARRLTGADALSGGSNTLVLYRSEGSNAKPVAVSGTVTVPRGKPPKSGWPVITYDHGTTGIADVCAPSRDTGSAPVHLYNSYAFPLLGRWVKAGYAVVRTDYQGLGTPGTHEYLVGREEGRSTLDIVRAARELDPSISKRVVIAGHSQGGHAALWAAALAPTWTRELNLRGTVAFAPASHISEQIPAVRAATSPGGGLSGEIALILRGLDTFRPGIGVRSILSDKALALYPETESKCLPELGQPDSFGGLAPSEMVRSDADLSRLAAGLDASDPENLKIATPLDVEQGKADTTVVPGLTDDLVKQLRGRGTKIVYRTYPNVTHSGVVVSAAGHATAYIEKHLPRH